MTMSTVPRPTAGMFLGDPGLGAASAGGVASAMVNSVRRATAGGVVRSVTLRSNLSPDLVLDPTQAVGPGGGGPRRRGGFNEWILAFAKPEIELDTAAGRIKVAPWGSPTTNLFWPAMIVGGASIAALAILTVKGLSK